MCYTNHSELSGGIVSFRYGSKYYFYTNEQEDPDKYANDYSRIGPNFEDHRAAVKFGMWYEKK